MSFSEIWGIGAAIRRFERLFLFTIALPHFSPNFVSGSGTLIRNQPLFMAMSPLARSLLAVTLISSVAGCGLAKNMANAGKSVDAFHQKFNDQKFAVIYSAATPAFKGAMKEADFLKFMQAVHRKLGAFKSGTQAGWRGNTTVTGTTVVLAYNSQFEKSTAVETFTFIVSGESSTLQGYNINSNALITD